MISFYQMRRLLSRVDLPSFRTAGFRRPSLRDFELDSVLSRGSERHGLELVMDPRPHLHLDGDATAVAADHGFSEWESRPAETLRSSVAAAATWHPPRSCFCFRTRVLRIVAGRPSHSSNFSSATMLRSSQDVLWLHPTRTCRARSWQYNASASSGCFSSRFPYSPVSSSKNAIV